MKKWDVLIIGSGISALTCAALLAKKGKSVCVLEQYNKPGGYLHCFNRFGLRFDTGAHYVGAMEEGQPFRALLQYLGIYEDDLFVPLDPAGFDHLHFPELQVRFPKGYEDLIHSLGESFPNERNAIRKYFDHVRTVVTHFPTYEFNGDSQIEIPLYALETSLADVVSSLTDDPALKCVLYGYCVLHGVDPEDIPFGFHAIVTDSLVRGPFGFKQGGEGLIRKFVKRIQDAGGQVLCKRRVTRLITKNRQIEEVITDKGENFAAEWIISGIHPRNVFKLVSDPDVFSPAFKDRIANIQESVGIFGVYASCSPDVPFKPLSNYYFFSSMDPRSFLKPTDPKSPGAVFAARGARLAQDPAKDVPVSFHSASPMSWFDPWRESSYGARSPEYVNLKNQIAEGMFQSVERYEPGLRWSLKQFVTSTPLTNLHFNGSAEGSAYGIYHSIQNTGPRALGPRTHISNLLLTGQSSLFPGLLGAAVSALRTSGHLVGIKPILNDLRNQMRGFA